MPSASAIIYHGRMTEEERARSMYVRYVVYGTTER